MSNRIIADIKGYGKCYLTIPVRIKAPRPGDIIDFTAHLSKPSQRKDIDTEFCLDNFFYRNYITSAGTTGTCSVVGKSHSLRWKAEELRSRLTDIIIGSNINDKSKELLTALLLGDRSLMPEVDTSAMSKAGLSHILALSGLHIAIIAFLIGLLLFPLTWGEITTPRYIIIIVLLWVYAFITGLSPSVTRAVIMVSIALTGRVVGRSGTTFNSLCLAVIILIVANPRIIYAPGFQLTVAAVAAICLLLRLLPDITIYSAIKRTVIYWLIFSISAVAGTLLLSIYYFHIFPVYFLLANVPAAILLPVLLGTGLILITAGALGLNIEILNKTIDLLCNTITSTADTVSSLPGANVENIYLPWWSIPVGYALLIAIGIAFYYKNKIVAMVTVSALCLFIVSVSANSRGNELFISRNSEATTIVIADRYGIKAKTTFPKPGDKDYIDALPGFYPDFFNLHGFKQVQMMADCDSGYQWKTSGRIIATPHATIAFINNASDNRPYPDQITYALIGRGYTGEITNVVETLRPDTILLGTDIHPRRMNRFMKELNMTDQPFRSLKDPYGLHLEF